jgi:hypothetical protein
MIGRARSGSRVRTYCRFTMLYDVNLVLPRSQSSAAERVSRYADAASGTGPGIGQQGSTGASSGQ